MVASRPDDFSRDMAAILDWWREAGVDCAFTDDAREWITAPDAPSATPVSPDPARFGTIKAVPPTTIPPAPDRIGGDRADWPADLPGFAPWWLSDPALDDGQVRGRVPPRGAMGAPLLVLVGEPEVDDGDTLLAGPQGRLLTAMLSAMGLTAAQVYVASALPRHTPMADWRDLAARGLGDVVRWHVGLARPLRIIAFGRQLAALLAPDALGSPSTGNGLPQTGAVFQLSGATDAVPLLIARDLGAMLERPATKGQFWQNWLEWSAA